MSDELQADDAEFFTAHGIAFDLTPTDIRRSAQDLVASEAADTDGLDTDALAEYVSALKDLEDAAEDARDRFEAALDDRVSTGETVADLRKTAGTNRYVTDHKAAFDAVLDAGEDPREVAKVSASKLADVLGSQADPYIDESEYTYYRRS